MPYYVEKPVVLELYQWYKNGDIPGDGVINNINAGAIVSRLIDLNTKSSQQCGECGQPNTRHGRLVKTNEIICPGDYIQFIRNDRKTITDYIWLSKDYVNKHLILVPPTLKGKVK